MHLKLSNRGRKGALERLPGTIEVPETDTIEQAKAAIARRVGVADPNRIGVFNPETRKIFGDRNAVVGAQVAVVSTGRLLVQDLGPQMGYRTVFLVEYFGPILFHGVFLGLHSHVSLTTGYLDYDKSAPLTRVQLLLFALFQLHFVKRELETAFLHKFSHTTVPAWNIFRNSAFYWLMSGLLCCISIYAARSPVRYPMEARTAVGALDWVGVGLFVLGEWFNFVVHRHLASLRATGGTERGIPNCAGSSLVTSPNYMFEVMSWIGVILISRDLTVVAFILTGIAYMRAWSRGKEDTLRRLFPDRYKEKRYTMLPGLI